MGNGLEKSIRIGSNSVLINHPDPTKDEFLLLEQRFFLHKSRGCLRRISHLDFYNILVAWATFRSRPFSAQGTELKFTPPQGGREVLIQPGGFFFRSRKGLSKLTRREFFRKLHRNLDGRDARDGADRTKSSE